MSRVMRNSVVLFAYAKTKRSRSAARDQCLCDSAIPLSSLPFLCGYKAVFVSDLVGNPEDRFSRDATD